MVPVEVAAAAALAGPSELENRQQDVQYVHSLQHTSHLGRVAERELCHMFPITHYLLHEALTEPQRLVERAGRLGNP